MTPHFQKDFRKRQSYASKEIRHRILQIIQKNSRLDPSIRWKAQTSLSREGSLSPVQNRCVVSGKGRGVRSSYSLSGPSFRRLCREKSLPGVRVASW